MSAPHGSDRRNRIADLELRLNYRHGLGAHSPFFDALLKGEALASRCPICDDRRFPPRLICPKDRAPTESWSLSGRGTLVRLTIGPANALLESDGTEEVFGEVMMHGATNRVFARIEMGDETPREGRRVELALPRAGLRHPIQALVFTPVTEMAKAN